MRCDARSLTRIRTRGCGGSAQPAIRLRSPLPRGRLDNRPRRDLSCKLGQPQGRPPVCALRHAELPESTHRRRFCSDRCRATAWQAQRRQEEAQEQRDWRVRKEGRMAILRVLCFVSAAFLVSPSLVHSADVSQEGLRGLPGVHLFVGDIKPDVEKDGVRKASIHTDVERRLRSAGIRILTQEEWRQLPGWPFLSINVATFKARGSSMYAFVVEVAFREQVTAVRTGRSLTASTWESDVIGTARAANLAGYVRENVRG